MFLLEFVTLCFLSTKSLHFCLSRFLLLEKAQSENVHFGKLTLGFISSIWCYFFLQYADTDYIEENQTVMRYFILLKFISYLRVTDLLGEKIVVVDIILKMFHGEVKEM